MICDLIDCPCLGEKSLRPEFLEEVALYTEADRDDGTDDKVTLMTVHSAKGLEFDRTVLIDVKTGILSNYPPDEPVPADKTALLEEERRLFYVAITRARDKLFITSCLKRRKMTMVADCEPSRFLDEIPANLVEYHEPKEFTQEESHEILSGFLDQLKAKL